MKNYIDCGSGIAGDMLLGAFVGLGLPPKELERMLQEAIREKGWGLEISHIERGQWPAWAMKVRGDRTYGSLEKMRACVRRTALPAEVKKNALQIFDRLETAEAQAHGHKHARVDPRGLGLLDTLIDVLGNSWGFWKLKLDPVSASPINTGRIAPATAAMLRKAKVPVYSTTPQMELATPTGVAILLQFAKEFKPMPELRLEKVGYGAGTADPKDRANVVGVYCGTTVKSVSAVNSVRSVTDIPVKPTKPTQPTQPAVEAVLLLSTVIDDMDPRLYPHVMDLLLKAGALDVWWTPIGMKKGRPGISFSVLGRPESEAALRDVLFRETTTLGIRRQPLERWVLPRKTRGFHKIAQVAPGKTKRQVEFELARRLSQEDAIPLLKLLK